MHSEQIEKMLEQLGVAAEGLSMGRYGERDQIFEMSNSERYPPVIARFAEAFGMMAVKIEARELRLEQIIDDLTVTKDELTISNEKLQLSLRELQQAQMQLIQQAKLESVGRLAAGVAHEVKNPLAVIQLGVDFLAGQLKENPPCLETVMDMADAVQRADAVIKGLLDFSRSEQLDLKQSDIFSVIDDSLLLVRHELNSRHIAVDSIKPSTLPSLPLDRNKLKQVFINLFMNAAHAMPDGGNLTITASVQTLTDEELSISGICNGAFKAGDKVVMIQVADTGTGIVEDAVTKLFDPFFTTKPVGIGTGLGLSITRKILELHSAVILLRNRSDRRGAEAVMLYKINQEES